MESRLNRERKTIEASESLWEKQPILLSHQSLGLRESVLLGLSHRSCPPPLSWEETSNRVWERNGYPEGNAVMLP